MKNCPIDLFNRNSASQLNLLSDSQQEVISKNSAKEEEFVDLTSSQEDENEASEIVKQEEILEQ